MAIYITTVLGTGKHQVSIHTETYLRIAFNVPCFPAPWRTQGFSLVLPWHFLPS